MLRIIPKEILEELAIIDEAINLLSNNGWCKNVAEACGPNGEKQFCMGAAITAAHTKQTGGNIGSDIHFSRLNNWMQERYNENVVEFNDAPETTYDQVISRLREYREHVALL